MLTRSRSGTMDFWLVGLFLLFHWFYWLIAIKYKFWFWFDSNRKIARAVCWTRRSSRKCFKRSIRKARPKSTVNKCSTFLIGIWAFTFFFVVVVSLFHILFFKLFFTNDHFIRFLNLVTRAEKSTSLSSSSPSPRRPTPTSSPNYAWALDCTTPTTANRLTRKRWRRW